ncbi:hypothetical protein [Streptomyces acidiscabies]|uniref:Enoyl-CoA hydratase n=1 Tax=Streptomyces acidiscabies TaxID=42234 RepID=A0A0L0KI08_9ACTN|nr:hypothetical protein [Streptomyces acidiscabies]KND37270.1 hypothetical protein IQ63_10120 [Streptomyces acidiscabies]
MIRTETVDGVLVMTLDRPEARNAVDPEAAAALSTALDLPADAQEGAGAFADKRVPRRSGE